MQHGHAVGLQGRDLLVYGGRDKLVSVRMARRAAGVFRDARLTIIPDSGHVAMMEHPELVARAFSDLLYEVRGAVGRGARGGERTSPGPTTRLATGS